VIATTTEVNLLYFLLNEYQFRVIMDEDNQTAMSDPLGGLYAFG
jgi:hypothetical protein